MEQTEEQTEELNTTTSTEENNNEKKLYKGWKYKTFNEALEAKRASKRRYNHRVRHKEA